MTRFGTVAILLAGCGMPRLGEPRPARPPDTRSPVASVAERLPTLSIGPPLDELARARDYWSYAVFVDQQRANGFVSPTQTVDLSRLKFDRVKVYLRGFDTWGAMDAPVAGCMASAISSNGTLCPSVLLPGRALSAAEVERLLQILNTPLAVDRASMCIDSYHHAFVFYAGAVPVAQLIVSFECGTWRIGTDDQAIPWTAMGRLRRLCIESRVGMCFLGTPDQDRVTKAWVKGHFDKLARGLRRKPRKLPVAMQTPLRDLSPRDRRKLCVWNTQHVVALFTPGRWQGFDQDWWLRTLDWRSCEQLFPSCSATVGEMLPCIDLAQRGDPGLLDSAVPSRCREQRECMWGFELRRGPEPEPG